MAIRDYKPVDPETAKIVGELFGNARKELLMKHPFSGSMALHLAPRFTADPAMPTSCTDGANIAVDAEFFKRLSAEERMVVIAHNVWHCALLHWDRQKQIGNDVFDYAADLEIDLLLQKDHFNFPILPHDAQWESLSLEQVCELLPAKIDRKLFWDMHLRKDSRIGGTSDQFPEAEKEKKKNEGAPESKSEKGKTHKPSADEKGKKDAENGGDAKSDENGNAGDADGDSNGQGNAGEQDGDSNGQGNALNAASGMPVMDSGAWKKIRQECAGKCKGRGTLPADMENLFLAGEKATQNWKEILRDYISMCISHSRTWIPPNRRHVYRKLYLPGTSRQTEIELVIAIDTSGSTFMYLQQFLDELNEIFRSFGEYHVTIINCDADISSVKEYSSEDGEEFTSEYNFTGGGGTDLRPPFRYVQDVLETPPQCLLYFTDGFGPAPDEAPAYPVLWCLTPDGEVPANWGCPVVIGEKEDEQ